MKKVIIIFSVIFSLCIGFGFAQTSLAQTIKVCPKGNECELGYSCKGGQCVEDTISGKPQGCTNSSSCAPNQECKAGQCVNKTATCASNSDCKIAGQACVAGQCVSSSISPTPSTSPSTTPSTGTQSVTALSNPLKYKNINDLIKGIINFVLGFVGVIAAVMIIYGGIMYMTSAGNDQRVQSGKTILTYSIIGLIITIAAGIIVQLVIGVIGG